MTAAKTLETPTHCRNCALELLAKPSETCPSQYHWFLYLRERRERAWRLYESIGCCLHLDELEETIVHCYDGEERYTGTRTAWQCSVLRVPCNRREVEAIAKVFSILNGGVQCQRVV